MSIAITTPVAYRTYQRNASNQADIAATGTSSGIADGQHVQARFNDGTWTRIATIASNAWSGTLGTQNAGQGNFEVRHEESTGVTASKSYVGIGDLIGGLGQSNMAGPGDNAQVYSHATLKATYIADGVPWSELTETSGHGSFRPALATSIMARTGFPVGFVLASFGGTPIAQFLPGQGRYEEYTARVLAAGSIRGTLWWQGESDVVAATSQAAYAADLTTIVNALYSDLGTRTMPCKLETIGLGYEANEAVIRAAIAQVWAAGGHCISGVDLVSLAEGGVHVVSDAGLTAVAGLWFTQIDNANWLGGPVPGRFVVTRVGA